MKLNKKALLELDNSLKEDFITVQTGIKNIKEKLRSHSDGKTLKGDEIVGWYGEVCCRQITGGKLVPDNNEYDVVTPEGNKISVKTRKGYGSGWKTTSAIPKINIDEDSPTHLMFIHLAKDYSVKEIWLFEWDELLHNNRFIPHVVRGNRRAYIFRINPDIDHKNLIFKVNE